ncbi:MAG TPA: DUF3313 domain-containing protein [Candidatus Sulfotelmatobacter sp.]|jgi:hypothetical protein|nr:DUF3313 domain-containing protein [Candidatus Sulfotelmatobacter sp.]
MVKLSKSRALAMLAGCAALAACSSPDPVPYSGLASSSRLAPNLQDEDKRTPYRFASPVDWRTYNKLILDPVAVYRGADQQFDDLSEEDKNDLASYMQKTFAEKLRRSFIQTQTPAPGALRIKLTLTGAASTTMILGTLSHFDIAGGLYNSVQSVRGREGTLTGSVSYAVEIYDAPTNRLLTAFITKQYPNAMNITATMGSLGAAKVGIEKGADALVQQLTRRSESL